MAARLSTELVNFPSRAVTADFDSGDFDVSQYTAIQIDVDCTVAAAAVNIVVERKSPNGVYFPVFATAPTVAGGAKVSLLIAPGVPAGSGAHQGVSELPGQVMRVTFDITTSATLSATVYGR
jgi:hypothetical protein